MTGGASVELDFFGMEKGSSSKSQFQKLLEHGSNVKAVQTAISKSNPQILKTVISSGASMANSDGKLPENEGFIKHELVFPPNSVVFGTENPFSVTSTSKGNQCVLPVFNSVFRAPSSESSTPGKITTPLTIFFNGTVSVFDLPHDKAEMIMKLAEEGNSKVFESVDMKLPGSSSSNAPKLLEKLNGDLPIARKKSLQRFLEKRKERLTSATPYANGGKECGMDKKQED